MDGLISDLEERLTENSARGLVVALTSAIREGRLRPGDRLPAIRTLAAQLKMSPTTVASAWAQLARAGAVRTDGRRGTTVTAAAGAGPVRYRDVVPARSNPSMFTLDLSTGLPDPELLPDLGQALRDLELAPRAASYLDPPMLAELAAVLAADWPYPAAAMAVSDGAMDAVEQLARAVLQFGDRVVVETPCFAPLLDLLDALGAELLAVPMDDEGMDPGALRAAMRHGPAAVFLQPRAQNPTGVSMTARRARALARELAGGEIVVVEDDSAGDIASAPPVSLGRWIPEQTVHIRSYAKSHGPDLRIAALSGPVALIGELDARRHLGQGWTSRILQSLLLHLLTDAESVDAVRSARAEYRRRRSVLAGQLAPAGIVLAGDGINAWVPVADETAALVHLASRGIGAAPGRPFDVGRGGGDHIRVTIGLVDPSVEDLATVLAEAAHAGELTAAR